MYEKYESPLSSRYASEEMLYLFSQKKRIQVWRRLWTALARAEHDLGLPITAEQVAELEAHIDDIDFACAAQREREVRHDVMAHVYAYGKAAPGAAGVIHLGATSCYVTDNGDLILYRDGQRHLRKELLDVLKKSCGLCGEIQVAAHPRLYPLSARAACYRGQTGDTLNAGFSFRPGGTGARTGTHEIPRLPWDHRYRGQFSGAIQW